VRAFHRWYIPGGRQVRGWGKPVVYPRCRFVAGISKLSGYTTQAPRAHKHTHTHIYIYTCMHTYIQTRYIHSYTHTYMHTYINLHMHHTSMIHAYTHTYMHACLHTCVCFTANRSHILVMQVGWQHAYVARSTRRHNRGRRCKVL